MENYFWQRQKLKHRLMHRCTSHCRLQVISVTTTNKADVYVRDSPLASMHKILY